TGWPRDWSSDVCSSDLVVAPQDIVRCVPCRTCTRRHRDVQIEVAGVVTTDFNNDRAIDFVLAGGATGASILLNPREGKFTPFEEIGRASCRERGYVTAE